MNKVIFVGFETEQQAYEGDRALNDLHSDGTLTLYVDAVVVKNSTGNVVVRQGPETEPVGTFGGMITGGLIGLLGGPVGASLGLGAGTLLGAAFDLTQEGIDHDFVEDAGARLARGTAALIAEIDEEWQVPLDTRMQALGASVLRQTRTQISDAYFERSVEAAESELATLQAERVAQLRATESGMARRQADQLQAKINAAQLKFEKTQNEIAAKIQAMKAEAARKIARLEAQKAIATAERQALVEERLAQIQSDYARRTKRLQDALESWKEAHPTVA